MGGTPTQSNKQDNTTTTTLPAGQQRNVDALMRGALEQYQTGGPQYYAGQTYAGPSAGELLSRDMATRYATGAGQQHVNAAQQGDQFWLDTDNIYNPENVPGFRGSQDYVTKQITRNLTENILPQIRGGSVATGTLGGSRQEIGEGLATEGTASSIGQTLRDMELGIYDRGMNMYNQAAGRAGAMFDLGLAPAEVVGAAGAAGRADEQQAIDADVQRFNFEQLRPLLNLAALQGFTGTAGQYGGTSTTKGKGTASQDDGGSGAMQLAGTIITAIAMIYSHSSAKENIQPQSGILERLDALTINRWNYKGDRVSHIGPMAEDFHELFGVGDGVTLNVFDLLGVVLGAIKELSIQRKPISEGAVS